MLPSRKRPADETVSPMDTVWDPETVEFASGILYESMQAITTASLADQPFPTLTPPSLKELEPVLRQRFSRLRKRLEAQADLRRRERAGPPPPKRRRQGRPPPQQLAAMSAAAAQTHRQQPSGTSGKPLVVRMTERELCRDIDELEHTLLWLALLDCTRALAVSGQEEARRHPEFPVRMRCTMERAKKAMLMTYGCRYSQ